MRITQALTRKIGPLPAWAWLTALTAAILLYRHYHQTSAPAAAAAPVDTTTAATPDTTSAAQPLSPAISDPTALPSSDTGLATDTGVVTQSPTDNSYVNGGGPAPPSEFGGPIAAYTPRSANGQPMVFHSVQNNGQTRYFATNDGVGANWSGPGNYILVKYDDPAGGTDTIWVPAGAAGSTATPTSSPTSPTNRKGATTAAKPAAKPATKTGTGAHKPVFVPAHGGERAHWADPATGSWVAAPAAPHPTAPARPASTAGRTAPRTPAPAVTTTRLTGAALVNAPTPAPKAVAAAPAQLVASHPAAAQLVAALPLRPRAPASGGGSRLVRST